MNSATASAHQQVLCWMGSFGREYTDRNEYSPDALDDFYRQTYGISRSQLNENFLRDVPRSARILEVGCNMGTQLLMLQRMGFKALQGIEIQLYALEKAKARVPHVGFCRASALSIPYPDAYFDLVFTSGVLIHIAPRDLPAALREIRRCAKRWIWGFEYFATEMSEVPYRGCADLLWKADYARLYMDQFPDLKKVKEQRLSYLQNKNQDSMFLLQCDPQFHREEQS